MVGHKHASHRDAHSHMGWVGLLGLAAGLGLMIYVPRLRAVSDTPVLFAGLRVVGLVVTLASLYGMAGRGIARHLHRRKPAEATHYDFGWTPWMTLGPWMAALVAAAAAVTVQVVAPEWWPVSLLLVLLAASFFAGYLIAREANRPELSVLPMVDLLSGETDLVLDGGCGAGRTTLAIGRVLKQGRIVALDRFNADYIDGGGRTLLERNLRLAGLEERVSIEQGDLTRLPFPDETFDSAVSTHAVDHLGAQKEQGLREMLRVLKPGGRFLLVVWVPGWAAFALGSVFSFLLTSKEGWRQLASRAGFEQVDAGDLNGFRFLLLQRPSLASGAAVR